MDLSRHNTFLSQSKDINETLAAYSAERAVYDSIDTVLEEGTQKIEQLLEKIQTADDKRRIIADISIIACSMKRECMLLINSFYQRSPTVNIMLSALCEMREYAHSAGIELTIGCTLSGDMPKGSLVTIYRMFCEMVYKAARMDCPSLVVQLYDRGGEIVFSTISQRSLFNDEEKGRLIKRFTTSNCTAVIKPWDETHAHLLNIKGDILLSGEGDRPTHQGEGNVKLSEMMSSLRREQEYSRIRSQVHDVMSQRLTALQRLSKDDNLNDYSVLFSLTRDVINQIKAKRGGDPGELFGETYFYFRKIGLSIELLDELPKEHSIAFMFIAVLREACTNAVKHAGATKVYARIERQKDGYRIEITNNGTRPKKGLVEGGGLFGIRNRVENLGGTLKVEVIPQFSLIITIKGEED